MTPDATREHERQPVTAEDLARWDRYREIVEVALGYPPVCSLDGRWHRAVAFYDALEALAHIMREVCVLRNRANRANGAVVPSVIEEWRPVLGYDDFYEVSSLGRVRSLRFSTGNQSGSYPKLRKEPLVLKPYVNHNQLGYLQVHLVRDGRRKCRNVHVLVLEAFYGPRPDGMDAAHENGIGTDCRLENLKWKTPSENMNDKYRHHTAQIGEQNPFRRFNEEQVRQIRRWAADGISQRQIARDLGCSGFAVWSVVHRRSWKHVA